MPRKRSSKNIPPHIKADKLPERVWFNTSGAGKWMLNYYDEFGRRKTLRLCGPKATLAEIWQATEAKQKSKVATFATLSAEFQTTHQWKKLAPSTQSDYRICHIAIVGRDTSTGKLGDVPLDKWTVGLIRKYRDKRAEESESRANKELAYIRRLFAWAYEYEKMPANPAVGIKKISIPPRQHYATDSDYHYLLNVAKQSGYWYVQYAMELAYLCRMRMAEVLDLTDANELPKGLIIYRRKGSKTNITEWTPRLRAAWDALKQKRNAIWQARKQPIPVQPDQRFLLINERGGDRVTRYSFKIAINRVSHMAKDQAKRDSVDYTHFTFHDIKKKGCTDTVGNMADKMKATGHRSPSMMRVYDLSVDTVKPTR
jgi:site-specific recombinase XerD